MEEMQFEKVRGNFSDEKDYVNSKIMAAKVQEAMGLFGIDLIILREVHVCL